MKKVLSLVLALSMVLGMFSFAFASSSLEDIEGTKYAGAVDSLVELGVVNGYTDGTYRPNQVVTRAEMAKMLVIALGQESAAKLAQGATQFTDVASNHWASGYINVAAQSGVIKGYPDGTFAPEATVTYAEAVTMAVRALGYGNVVESKGTWPTNYMTKAVELELLDDIGSVAGDDGALRGNVALLLWNTLTSKMWVVVSENATNGITYAESEKVMLNYKFPKYEYFEKATVSDITFNKTKATVKLVDEDRKALVTAELLKGDFLNLYGKEVTALYNKDTEKLLSVMPTANNDIVEGKVEKVSGKTLYIEDEDKEGYTLISSKTKLFGADSMAEAYKAYVVLDKDGDPEYAVGFGTGTTIVVEKVRETDTGVTLTPGSMKIAKKNAVIIKNNEVVTIDDIEVDDVVTKLDSNLYVIGSETVDGTFTKLVKNNSTDKWTITVDGEVYDLDNDFTYYVDGEKESQDDFNTKDMKDEDITITLNYLGVVVRVEAGEKSGSEGFYVISVKKTWTEKRTDYIELIGVDGEAEEYAFHEDFDGVPTDLEISRGALVSVKFKNGEIEELEIVAEFDDNEENAAVKVTSNNAVYGDDEYKSVSGTVTDIDTSKNLLTVDGNEYKVSSSTVVYKPAAKEGNITNGKNFKVTVENGMAAVKGSKNETVAIVYDTDSLVAKYVVIGEVGTGETFYGIVKESDKETNKQATITVITEDGELDYVVAKTIVDKDEIPAPDSVIAYELNADEEISNVVVLSMPREVKSIVDGRVTFADGERVDYTEDDDVVVLSVSIYDEDIAEAALTDVDKDSDLVSYDELDDGTLVFVIYPDYELDKKETLIRDTTTEIAVDTGLEVAYKDGNIRVTGEVKEVTEAELGEGEYAAYGFANTHEEGDYYFFMTLTAPAGVEVDEGATIDTGTNQYDHTAFDGDNFVNVGFRFTENDTEKTITVKWNEKSPEYTITIDLSGVDFPVVGA